MLIKLFEEFLSSDYGHPFVKKFSQAFTLLKSDASAILVKVDLKKTEFPKVGDVFQQGLSGRERRRLSFALELVSKPALIILDETTSGLDSYAAEKVMKALRGLAEKQKTAVILATIHQLHHESFR